MKSSILRRVGPAAALGLLVSSGFVPPAAAAHVGCGQVITQNTVLDSDVGPCAADGIIIGANNITLDLNGHRIFGLPTPEDGVGVRIEGRTGTQVKGPGTIRDFDAGVAILAGSANKVTGITATNNVGSGFGDFGDGIAINASNGNLVANSTVTTNGPFDGIGLFNGSSGNTINGNVVTDNSNLSTSHHGGLAEQDDGIRLEPGSTNNVVVNNEVKRNGLDGIAVFAGATDNTVKHNVVEGNGFHLQLHRKGDGIRVFSTGDRNLVQDNTVRSNAAHGIRVDSQFNSILTNTTSANVTFDLFDSNLNCDNNVWQGNTFLTAAPPCTMA